MTEISRRLRAARERAGLSIGELAGITKIRATALQAIERGEFERLPGDFYARAFLRAFAREVHLPPDEIVRQYDASRPTAPPAPEIRDVAVERPHRDKREYRSPPQTSPRRWAVPAEWIQRLSALRNAGALATLACMVLLSVLVWYRPVDDGRREAGAVGTSGVAEPAPLSPVATLQAEAPPDRLVLEINPSGPIWVTGAADGSRVLYRLLAPGEHVIVEARRDLTFRIGNAAAFAYSINGVPGKQLGGPDEIREFQITRENFRTFRR